MKKVLFGVLAAAVLTATAPMAHAVGEQKIGGCFFNTDSQQQATNGSYVGVIGDRSVTLSASNAPIAATVYCKIQVNASDAPGTTFSYTGNGVQAGANQISFEATDTDAVTLCEAVDYGSGVSPYTCRPATTIQVPPQEVIDLLTQLQVEITDPILCGIIGSLAGTYGPITITPQGDITISPDPLELNPINDCPPYEF